LIEPAALLDLADEAPPVPFTVDEREQDLEDERLERQMPLDVPPE
jgi:hypothetical protein